MPGNIGTRTVDHEAEYSNTTFAALAEVWNREHVGSGMKMEEARTLDGIEAHIKNCVNAMQVARSSQPYKLLFPVQEGRDHWVGVMVSNDGRGNVSIIANDPLGADGGARTANLDVALLRTKEKLEEMPGVTVNEPIRDSAALQQNDKKACGPYVFENLTALAIDRNNRDERGRIALRESQMDMLPADSIAIKEVSVSKEADFVLKIIGDRLHSDGELEPVNSKRFVRALASLNRSQKEVLLREFGTAIFDHEADNFKLVQNRINFHIEHDKNGLRPDVLKHKLTTIIDIMKEFVESDLEIEQARQVSGLNEFIEQFKTNKDVDKLPPEVFAKITNPDLYVNEDFSKAVETAFARERAGVMAVPAMAKKSESGHTPVIDLRVDSPTAGTGEAMAATVRSERVVDRNEQVALDTMCANLLGRGIEVDSDILKGLIRNDCEARDIADNLGILPENTKIRQFISEQVSVFKSSTEDNSVRRVLERAEVTGGRLQSVNSIPKVGTQSFGRVK